MAASGSPAWLGDYELVAKIGEGGMGVVHLGRDRSGRQVAIKVLRPFVVGDDVGRARLAREVTSLRRVHSPRVAEVYDADPWGDQPYLVTRYVAGPSLHDHVARRGPVSGADLERLAVGLVQALVAVHDADVVHRDVKPSNVLLEGADPVLIDFGLAQLADDSRLTMTGWLLGTPGYLAPEILYGDDPSTRADVHSWASTVVFAATGHSPYGTGPAVAVLDRVRRSEHDLRGVPDSLSWLISQALLPNPGDRPNARQMLGWLTGPVLQPDGDQLTSRLPLGFPPAAGRPDATRTGPILRADPPPASRRLWLPDAAPTAAQPAASTTSVPATPTAVQPALTRRTLVGQAALDSVRPTTADHISGSPVGRVTSRPGRIVVAGFWLLVSLAVVVGFVTAPGVTAVVVFGCAWLLRVAHLRQRAVTARQARRGPRRSDELLTWLGLPWFGLVAFPAAVVNAVIALLDGVIVVVIGIIALRQGSLAPLLAAGAVVVCLFLWWGPFGRGLRSGGDILTRAVLRGGATTGFVLVLMSALIAALIGWRLANGVVFTPLPHPPWEPQLRSLFN